MYIHTNVNVVVTIIITSIATRYRAGARSRRRLAQRHGSLLVFTCVCLLLLPVLCCEQ